MNNKCKVCGTSNYHINKNGICKRCAIKYKRTCKVCGKQFYSAYPKRICSDKCSQIDYLLRSENAKFEAKLRRIYNEEKIQKSN